MIRRLVALLLILVSVALALRLIESRSSAEDLRHGLDEARRTGLLGPGGNASAPDPAADAAMRRYVAACALMPDGGVIHFAWLPLDAALPGLSPAAVASPAELAEASQALAAFDLALALVRRGAETAYARPDAGPARGVEPERLNLALGSLVALLRARCHVAAARGEADEALRSCTDALRLLDLCQGFKLLPIQSWRLSAVTTLASTAAWAASTGRPSSRACREALEALASVALVDPMKEAVRGETVADLRGRLSGAGEASSLRGWAMLPWRRRQVAAYLRHMSQGFQALARVGELRSAGRAWAPEAQRLGASFYVEGALSPLVGAAVAVDLGMLTVAGRLAADEGEPAACLDDLSQTLVPSSNRVDPWSGSPYCWGTGPWAAYSVGPDGRDDGGDPQRDLCLARVR